MEKCMYENDSCYNCPNFEECQIIKEHNEDNFIGW